MEGHHHDLAQEFPEFKDKIHSLKIENAHFKNLSEQYEAIDKEIARAESRIESRSEEDEEHLRKQRLALKDQIFAMLNG